MSKSPWKEWNFVEKVQCPHCNRPHDFRPLVAQGLLQDEDIDRDLIMHTRKMHGKAGGKTASRPAVQCIRTDEGGKPIINPKTNKPYGCGKYFQVVQSKKTLLLRVRPATQEEVDKLDVYEG